MTSPSSPEQPWPVRTVARKVAEWIGRLGEVWVEGQVAQLSRRGGAATVFLTLRDPAADLSIPVTCPREVADHGAEFGWVVRYPDGAQDVTGYKYEPWHVRYVGVALATELQRTGTRTLEEFFGLPAAPGYPG